VKLASLKTKTAIEVTDDDLLIIEDIEDTKTITVEQFKLLMNAYTDTRVKTLFNECIDRVNEALEKAKFVLPIYRKFLVNSWIGSTSGNVQISLKDLETNKWLTREELVALIIDKDGNFSNDFKVRLFADGVYNNAQFYQLLPFREYHDRSANEWLYDSDAGFIKASFGTFEQNTIAAIQSGDIIVTIENRTIENEDEDSTEKEYCFIFVTDKNSFANSVKFMSKIPPGDPAWLGG